ncbi:response regulator transcription factor [Frankia sp. Mgl5]|uniref:response regulator transcription factor n=1 Tax=Frankiaceae TaxID=74712 RepID=UPI000DA48D74|nr:MULTISPECIES: response regulator transcription factor [Frankiaceae]MCK9931801.1 response regulator transcription factor [Frankia sp. Mgl5]TCJ36737.1 response regulator transcription factor [Parafrankia sp. BMG5.11]CAI7973426.1 Sensory transduction protein RegX3 [Frankia sp. Hr75.2]SQD94516.1 Sensory transduction protein regX3 [Parafrankia sp. Ea1.12]
MARVLLVDDDTTVSDVVSRYLSNAGFEVDTAADGWAALATAERRPPDLVVLDLMLPGLPGLEVCRRLRAHGHVPVVMLTALGAESDRITGLETGADDYVTKPFSPRELVLRVQSVLRRTHEPPPGAAGRPVLRGGGLVVDVAGRTVSRDGREVSLTVREFDLLAFLLRHPGEAFSRAVLLERVWGWTYGDTSTVTVHVRRLREKIEPDPTSPAVLTTVWGVGYRCDLATVAGPAVGADPAAGG